MSTLPATSRVAPASSCATFGLSTAPPSTDSEADPLQPADSKPDTKTKEATLPGQDLGLMSPPRARGLDPETPGGGNPKARCAPCVSVSGLSCVPHRMVGRADPPYPEPVGGFDTAVSDARSAGLAARRLAQPAFQTPSARSRSLGAAPDPLRGPRTAFEQTRDRVVQTPDRCSPTPDRCSPTPDRYSQTPDASHGCQTPRVRRV